MQTRHEQIGHTGAGHEHSRQIAIVQSSYVPWKGYFDLIGLADEFILYDIVRYSKHDWRNRNRIVACGGPHWLTIPVRTAGRSGAPINAIEVSDHRWAARHWKSICTSYARAPYFDRYRDHLSALYEEAAAEPRLSRINELFIRRLAHLIGIGTRIRRAEEFDLPADRNLRLVTLCERTGATDYLTGPAARTYLDEAAFGTRGIRVNWMDYSAYAAYRQCWSHPFLHEVSILDLLLNQGPDSLRWLKCGTRWTQTRR